MKKITAIFLIFWICIGTLFPKTDWEEASKIPLLFLHHQQKHADLSFFEFLKLHYGENQNTHQDEEHEKLPMQKHSHLCQNISFICVNFVHHFFPKKIISLSLLQNFTIFCQNNYSFLPENTHFSPPKF
jgi:hypothetical protein